MLVITRREGESIFIGDDIEVVVLQSNGSRVRIGVYAPSGVSVVRTELIPPCELEIVEEE